MFVQLSNIKRQHWLGGKEGLWRFNGSRFANFSQNFVGCVYEDTKGNIWAISWNDNIPDLKRS